MDAIRNSKHRHVLVVDDDDLFRESLIENLLDTGYAVDGFHDGPAALEFLRASGPPNIILLDWRMPEMTGIEVMRQIRKLKLDAPIVFLTVLGDQVFEEAGLVGGAMDFVEKSRSFSILNRRLELILGGYKRINGSAEGAREDVVKCNDLILRRDISRAFWKGKQIDLTLTEFRIIERLVQSIGQDVNYRELYDIVHGVGFAAGDGEAGFRTNVRALIKRVKRKFRSVDESFSQIENYPGFGYRWSVQDER